MLRSKWHVYFLTVPKGGAPSDIAPPDEPESTLATGIADTAAVAANSGRMKPSHIDCDAFSAAEYIARKV
jgi:hypothetical protein